MVKYMHINKESRFRGDVDSLLRDLRCSAKNGLHLGAGGHRIENLLNCDKYDHRADLLIDALDLQVFNDESVDLIETHHMIEHLSFDEFSVALSEWNRCLVVGGILIITCPDITRICLRWLKYRLLYWLFPRYGQLEYTLKMFYGPQENAGMFHKSGYDKFILRKKLENSGFEVLLNHAPYPAERLTPSMIFIARKKRQIVRENR